MLGIRCRLEIRFLDGFVGTEGRFCFLILSIESLYFISTR